MPETCKKCGSIHIIMTDHMQICDDCLSTVVFNEDGTVFAEHLTSEDFKKNYMRVRAQLRPENGKPATACRTLYADEMEIPPILNLYGLALVGEKKYKDAIRLLKKAAELNPLYVTALYNLATAYELSEDHDKAVTYYDQALKNITTGDERYADIKGACALAMAKQRRFSKAEYYLEDAEKQGFEYGGIVRRVIDRAGTDDDDAPIGRTNRKEQLDTKEPGKTADDQPSKEEKVYSSGQTNAAPQGEQRIKGAKKITWPYFAGIGLLAVIFFSGIVQSILVYLLLIGGIAVCVFLIAQTNKHNAANGHDNFSVRRRKSKAEKAYKEALRFAQMQRDGYWSWEQRALNQSEFLAIENNKTQIAMLKGEISQLRVDAYGYGVSSARKKQLESRLWAKQAEVRNLEGNIRNIEENAKVRVYHDPDPTVQDPTQEEVFRKELGNEWYEIIYGNRSNL